MKKILVLLSLVIIALGCNKEPNPGKPDTPAIPAWEDTSAGWLVQSLADAYSQWEENNKLPSTVNWDLPPAGSTFLRLRGAAAQTVQEYGGKQSRGAEYGDPGL